MDLKNIYNEKKNIVCNTNINDLIDIIKNKEPQIDVTNNYNRTMLVTHTDDYNKNTFENTLKESIETFINTNLISPIRYIYDVMPIDKNNFILRI